MFGNFKDKWYHMVCKILHLAFFLIDVYFHLFCVYSFHASFLNLYFFLLPPFSYIIPTPPPFLHLASALELDCISMILMVTHKFLIHIHTFFQDLMCLLASALSQTRSGCQCVLTTEHLHHQHSLVLIV